MSKPTQKITNTMAIITILSALIATGCNEPKPIIPGYQKSDWAGLNKLITEIDQQEINECIKNKSTCQAMADDAVEMVKSMEWKK